jgi:hypothetical protein
MPMTFCRLPALVLIASIVLASGAYGQGFTPNAAAPGTSPWPPSSGPATSSPWNAPPAQSAQPPAACLSILRLRDDLSKRADALNAAGKRKSPPPVTCPLFTSLVAIEAKYLKAVQENADTCRIPAAAVGQLKTNHLKAIEVRARVCAAAARMRERPAGPSLSDALGTSRIPDSSSVKTGRGTFDTLTGTPLGSR